MIRPIAIAAGTLIFAMLLSGQTSTTTTLTSVTPAGPKIGQQVTLSATVSPANMGSVAFMDAGMLVGTGTVNSGGAQSTTLTLAPGQHNLIAVYGGSIPGNFAPSQSLPLPYTVTANSGNGFATPVTYAVRTAPQSAAIGDFDGNGIADLVVANYGTNNVSVLLGNGNGTFQPAVNYNAGTQPFGLAVGDFNRDGKVDLAVAYQGAHIIGALIGCMSRGVFAFAAVMLGSCALVLGGQESVPRVEFTPVQAEAGRVAYERSCGMCHTYAVSGRSGKAGELPPLDSLPEPYQKFIGPRKWVPALMGKHFVDTYGQKTLRDLFVLFRGAADSTPVSELKMSDDTLVNITAYILQKNGAKAGDQPLTAHSSVLFRSVVE